MFEPQSLRTFVLKSHVLSSIARLKQGCRVNSTLDRRSETGPPCFWSFSSFNRLTFNFLACIPNISMFGYERPLDWIDLISKIYWKSFHNISQTISDLCHSYSELPPQWTTQRSFSGCENCCPRHKPVWKYARYDKRWKHTDAIKQKTDMNFERTGW